MNSSYAGCRAQEKFQRSRAASTHLTNVRGVSEKAAQASAIEAVLAKKRGKARVLRMRTVGPEFSQEQHDSYDNENPDRGRADGPRSLEPVAL